MKEYASLDEVREALHDECECAFDDLLRTVKLSYTTEDQQTRAFHSSKRGIHFTIWITSELEDQIRKLA